MRGYVWHGMHFFFLHLLICVYVCNVKGAETSRIRHIVGCLCVCLCVLSAMAGCTLKCALADRVFLKDEQASVRVRQDGTLGSVERYHSSQNMAMSSFRSVCVCKCF